MSIIISSFTLIDAINQFWKVCGDGDRRALTCAGLTYYYLCNVWNSCGRPISFRRQNTLVCAELFISKPTLDKHRNTLKQHGLIDFFSRGKGDPNIAYKILEVGFEEVKKQKNFTTSFTSPFTSDDAYKQSTELEVIISGEVKNFYYLNELFSADPGLKMAWEKRFLPPEKFSDGLQQWMIQNHGHPYPSFPEARKHFLFWIPNYSFDHEKKKNGSETTKSTPAGATKTGTSAARVQTAKDW